LAPAVAVIVCITGASTLIVLDKPIHGKLLDVKDTTISPAHPAGIYVTPKLSVNPLSSDQCKLSKKFRS